MNRKKSEIICPFCQQEFRSDRASCPHCGSDTETGWSDIVDLYPMDDDNYEDIYRSEFGEPRSNKFFTLSKIITITLLVIFIATMLLRF